MSQRLFFLQSPSFVHQNYYHFGSLRVLPQCSLLSSHIISAHWPCNKQFYQGQFRIMCWQVPVCHAQLSSKQFDPDEIGNLFVHVQTLRNFPVEKLCGEVVIVRFDSSLLVEYLDSESPSLNKAFCTIKYLYNARAKVLLVSNWGQANGSTLSSVESLADHLSSHLQIKVVPAYDVSGFMQHDMKELDKADILLLDNITKFREERANCPAFSEKLSSGAVIFVNDAFSLSHKILASTVGVARFCYASMAGFHFEEELTQLMKTSKITRQPYMAIIGGSNFLGKSKALHLLASVCDGLILVGMLAFQVMHALGQSIPSRFLEFGAGGEALKLIHLACKRNIPIYFPNDIWCINKNTKLLDIFPTNGILTGWTPVDLGPDSMKEILHILSKCKKILWIGPLKFCSRTENTRGETELALLLEKLIKTSCDVTVVGKAACKAVSGISSAVSGTSNSPSHKMFKNASVVWEFLKGRVLPGVAALDRAFVFNLDWDSIFTDPNLPLVVDIGSGNGLFLLQLSQRRKDLNFLGLEINNKLVNRSLDILHKSGITNGYFLCTNATSTFRSIVSSYPGLMILVTIQCPNPDFNKEEHRWRMVQRTLVEAIVDLLATNGKIFLQSDIKAVTTRMKEQFMTYGKVELEADGDDESEWLEQNPFGVRSDWEQHVIDRGDPMYRVMLRKVDGCDATNLITVHACTVS